MSDVSDYDILRFYFRCTEYEERKIEWIDLISGRYIVNDIHAKFPYCKFTDKFLSYNTHDCSSCVAIVITPGTDIKEVTTRKWNKKIRYNKEMDIGEKLEKHW